MTRGFDSAMRRWNELRDVLKRANAAKDSVAILAVCDEILAFSRRNRDVAILDWLFERRAAKALADQGYFSAAKARMDAAIAGCEAYRASHALAKPDDFLKDLDTMRKARDRFAKKAGSSSER